MSYLVLARRLRPCRFDDLIGQEINSKILKNAVVSDRVAHAFLFAGSRGVGKTSAARILTRAINCLNHDNGNPCNNCVNCIDIIENASPDIFEIDAASNRGIDNIRELRENVNYVPARCRYKVYIVDEAHMLTLESFNALLKTLEEPPPYVKFIFATTDPHKLPQTIISRCQRYDFLRISIKQIADYLEKIIESENLEISRKSLEMIAQNSVGGMRDALTAMDQILSIEGESVTEKKVAQILGILDHESRFTFTESLLRKKDDIALIYFQKLQEHGYDVNDILADLLRTIKTTALIKALGTKPSLFQELSSDDLEEYEALANLVKNDELQQIFQILLQLEERLKVSSFSKICFEMAILQITSTDSLMSVKEIVSEIKNYSELTKKKEVNDLKVISDISKKNSNAEKQVKSSSNINEKKINQFDATTIKNILNSGSKERRGGNTQNKEESVKIANELNQNYVKQSIKTKEYKEKTDRDITVEYKKNNNKNIKNINDIQIETQKSDYLDLGITQQIDLKNLEKTIKKPPDEWVKFSQDAHNKSPKLASFVRNAIPQSLTESNLKLTYKSGNYSALLDEKSKKKLEGIASDLCGHSIQIISNDSKSFSDKQTIAEYEKIVLEEKKAQERKNAIDYHQVKEILSVFKNSKITMIKLSDE